MEIKNLKITKKVVALSLTGTLATAVLTGCGNMQIIDFNKSFNVAFETNNGYVSIVGIKEYSDYSGTQVQFVTEDNLRVLTSTHQTQLLKSTDIDKINSYALSLVGNNSDKIMDYNEMQGVSIDTSADAFNKDFIDWHFTYNKAIILTDDSATIVNLTRWKDYEEDDKIQLQLEDGTYILTNIDNVKLINDEVAKDDSLSNYAISLVGDENKVTIYEKPNQKTK